VTEVDAEGITIVFLVEGSPPDGYGGGVGGVGNGSTVGETLIVLLYMGSAAGQGKQTY
jgi:hypothetical protein